MRFKRHETNYSEKLTMSAFVCAGLRTPLLYKLHGSIWQDTPPAVIEPKILTDLRTSLHSWLLNRLHSRLAHSLTLNLNSQANNSQYTQILRAGALNCGKETYENRGR